MRKTAKKPVRQKTLQRPQRPKCATPAAKAFGEVIKAERQNRALSIEELAADARLTPERIREFERGEDEPGLMELWWISAALDMRASRLVTAAIHEVQNP
jgi:ribosome-binding protein aMBF1 (putative translation factor)